MSEKIQVDDFQQGIEIEEVRKNEETQIKFIGGEIWTATELANDFKAELKELMEKYFI